MPDQKHKMRWGLVLALGIIAVAIGVFINAYAIAVVPSYPFPAAKVQAISAEYQIQGYFFIGMGVGYLVLVPVIKNLDNKIRKMEKEPS